jgi:hypothetical protein
VEADRAKRAMITEDARFGITPLHRVVSYLEELMTNLRYGRIGTAEAASVERLLQPTENPNDDCLSSHQ